jgi:hypothetical protein
MRSLGRFVSRIPSARGRCQLAVEGAAHAEVAAIEDVGVGHGLGDIAVANARRGGCAAGRTGALTGTGDRVATIAARSVLISRLGAESG